MSSIPNVGAMPAPNGVWSGLGSWAKTAGRKILHEMGVPAQDRMEAGVHDCGAGVARAMENLRLAEIDHLAAKDAFRKAQVDSRWCWLGGCLAITCALAGSILLTSGALLAMAPAVPLLMLGIFAAPFVLMSAIDTFSEYKEARRTFRSAEATVKMCRNQLINANVNLAEQMRRRAEAEARRTHEQGPQAGFTPPGGPPPQPTRPQATPQ